MPEKILIPPDFEETSSGKRVTELSRLYGVSRTTIRKWLKAYGHISDYNQKKKNTKLYEKETAEVCLNCTSLRCLGYCDKFSR